MSLTWWFDEAKQRLFEGEWRFNFFNFAKPLEVGDEVVCAEAECEDPGGWISDALLGFAFWDRGKESLLSKKKGKHYLSSSNGDIVYQMKSCRIKMNSAKSYIT